MREELCGLCCQPALGYAKIGQQRYCHSDERSCYTQASRTRADALHDLARHCFDENDAGVIVGGIEVVETYVYDTIAALTGDERDRENADLMREVAGRSMAAKLGRADDDA